MQALWSLLTMGFTGIVELQEGVSIYGGYERISCPDRLLPARERQNDDPEACNYLPASYANTNAWIRSESGEALITGGRDLLGNAFAMKAVEIHSRDDLADVLTVARLSLRSPDAERLTIVARSAYGLFLERSRIKLSDVTIRSGNGANAISRPASGPYSRDGDDGVGRLDSPAFDGDDGEDGDSSLIGSRIVPNGGDGGRGINCVANGIQGQPGVGGPGGEGGSNEDYSDNRGDAGGPGSASSGALGVAIGGPLGSGGRGGRSDTAIIGDNSVNPIAGTNGGRGTNGANGVDGLAGADFGEVGGGNRYYLPADGTDGTPGKAGGGGGGGRWRRWRLAQLDRIMLAAAAAAVAQAGVPAKVDARDLAAAAPSRCTRLVYRTSSLQF